jgi:pimeloyl-ACP methyl ester carboxylesterase
VTANKEDSILIIHGWMVESGRYDSLKSTLEKRGYRVYVPDMPGNGVEIEPEKPFTLDDYVDFIKEYLKKKNIRSCTIVGHSFGGRVGIKLAANNPDLVDKLVLTGVPGFRSESWIKRTVFTVAAKIGRSLGLGTKMKKVLYRLAGTHDYSKTQGVMRETFKNIVNEDLEKPMQKIKCPTLLIWGKNDKIVPVRIAKKMQRYINSAQLEIISNTGHDVPYKNPNKFTKAL